MPKPATIPLAAVRDMLAAMLPYIPAAQRDNALAAALAVGIGHAV